MGNSTYNQSRKEGATYKCHNTGGVEFEKARERSLAQFRSVRSVPPFASAENLDNDSVHNEEKDDLNSEESLR